LAAVIANDEQRQSNYKWYILALIYTLQFCSFIHILFKDFFRGNNLLRGYSFPVEIFQLCIVPPTSYYPQGERGEGRTPACIYTLPTIFLEAVTYEDKVFRLNPFRKLLLRAKSNCNTSVFILLAYRP